MQEKTSSKRIIKFMLELWRISPWLTVLMLVIQIIAVFISTVIAPVFVSKLLSGISNGTVNIENSVSLIIGYTVTLLISEVILFRIVIALNYAVESKMQAKIDIRLFKHLTDKSVTFHSNKMSGGIVSNFNKLIGMIERFWDTVVWDMLPTLTTIVSVSVALSFIYWQYAIALAVLSIMIIFIIIKTQSRMVPISKDVAQQSSIRTAYMADAISNISAIKAYSREDDELSNFTKIVDQYRKAQMREMKSVVLITGTFSIIMIITNICAFIAAVLAVQYHFTNVGSIYLIIVYTMNVSNQVWKVAGSTRSYIRIVGDSSPMIEILDSEVEVKDPAKPINPKISNGKIEFKKVEFKHEQAKTPIFKNFSLVIKPGERVGLVGESGSGKTSLTRILLRFSDIKKGVICIDNQDISKLKQADLRNSIAYAPQEPVLFHRSIRENISYGKPDATEEEIKEAARQANALNFIEVLKDGFDTLVGERGVKLSGGQRQRIAIARAILKDAPVLVLDEATSALDSENEKLIQGAFDRLMKNRTSIVIAHRLSTIAKLDRIIVLNDGQIVEEGSHNKLLKQNGVYARLWSHQSGGFIKD